MTKLLFIRHAESDNTVEDNVTRPLTEFGSKTSTLIPKLFPDFLIDYKLGNGESLKEVQQRNILEVNKILDNHVNQNIVIGTHGTSLCTILNYFNNQIDFKYFKSIINKMPLFIEMTFNGSTYICQKELHPHFLVENLLKTY